MLKTWLALTILCAALLAGSARPAQAMDYQSRIWVRDTLIGAGVGLAVGLLADNGGTYLLVGGIAGAIVGYFDSEGSLHHRRGMMGYRDGHWLGLGLPEVRVGSVTPGEAGWGAARMESGPGTAKPALGVAATLFRADW